MSLVQARLKYLIELKEKPVQNLLYENENSTIPRRSLLKGGLATGVIALLSGCESRVDLRVRKGLKRPVGVSDRSWKNIRSQFILKRGVTYMNNASLGMPPAIVAEAVCEGYETISKEPLHGKHGLQEKILSETVPNLAKTFGAERDEVILTRNASEALHMQAAGLKLKQGDEVIITTQEHPAGQRPWMFRQKRDGIVVKEVFIPSPLESADDVMERFEDAITKRTRAISFCHVTRGGHHYPVKKLASMARDHGLVTLVDGAQAAGQFPIDLKDLGCDTYAVSLHKWMLAPAGTGFLYVRKDSREKIRSIFAPNPTIEKAPDFDPPGTKDFPVRAAIGTALDFVNTLGVENIEKRCRFLSDYLKSGLEEIKGVKLLSGQMSDISAPGSTIFEKEGLDAMASVPMMEERIGTHIDEHQRDGHNAIRISTHIYNNRAEIDRLLDAIARA
jgi:selenocysteine lyase/cysteine desulfurase